MRLPVEGRPFGRRLSQSALAVWAVAVVIVTVIAEKHVCSSIIRAIAML
jgi:hypothetical protein